MLNLLFMIIVDKLAYHSSKTAITLILAFFKKRWNCVYMFILILYYQTIKINIAKKKKEPGHQRWLQKKSKNDVTLNCANL